MTANAASGTARLLSCIFRVFFKCLFFDGRRILRGNDIAWLSLAATSRKYLLLSLTSGQRHFVYLVEFAGSC